MRLDILVPHYTESPSEMEPLLDSIALQQNGPEVGVIIAYDGPDAVDLPSEWWRIKYPFGIRHLRLPEHVGVSAARNAALDASDADYVMFCDCDDMLFSACGLYTVKTQMERGFDVFVSDFVEETRVSGEVAYVQHIMDSTFVHGKVYNRGFLEEKCIRFDPDLTVHEDSYFVTLAGELSENGRHCASQFYLWRWRDSSVCRHDPDYILKTYPQMLESNDRLVVELSRRGIDPSARVAAMVFDAYYTMNKPEWMDKTNAEYRARVEKRFARYMEDHRGEWESLPMPARMAVSAGVRNRSVMEGMGMEVQTMGQWLDSIGGAK